MMTATKPYLIRAFYEWIADNNCTPHIVVNADILGTDVPREYIEGGQIVLNVAISAVQSLSLGNDLISFQARFNGIARAVSIPIRAVMAIYARENGRGMVFTEDDSGSPPEEATNKGKKQGDNRSSAGRPPHLTVVK